MKIAIMGAGLSGLACAITLEQQGIAPVIFEKRSQVGDRFINAEALLPLQERPVQDSIAYLADKHSIFLTPISNITQLKFFAPHHSAVVSGNLGFTNLRGRDYDSFESQLVRQVKSRIVFNSDFSYERLLQDFNYVVLATGDAAYTAKLQTFHSDLTVSLTGATLEGKFTRNSVSIWLDNDLAPQGYGFLIPYSEHEANLTLAYPDYPHNQSQAQDALWEKFLARASENIGQDVKVSDRFSVSRYIIGTCAYPRIGNTFFVGNCFGSVMPAFGFGQFTSILTGVYAAQDLCGMGNYSELTKPLHRSYANSLVLRRAMEKLNNSRLDLLVSFLRTNVAQNLLNSRRNPLKLLSYALRPLV